RVERFYAVTGTSPQQVNRALGTNGPRREGRKAHALTEWRLLWWVRPMERAGRCTSGDTRVGVRLVTTLPRWEGAAVAPTWLVDDWGLFLARLRLHEGVHQEIAVRAAGELLARLEALEAESCDGL